MAGDWGLGTRNRNLASNIETFPLEVPPLPTASPPRRGDARGKMERRLGSPFGGNVIKLSENCDDYYGGKVHRFEGSKVL